jgi:drug/metabolite transporter (DMT)-like permease
VKTVSQDETAAAEMRSKLVGGLDRTAIGSILGTASAAIYTCSNICLRSVAHCDAFWVACMKAAPTLVVAAVLVGIRVARGGRLWLTPRIVAALIGTGLLGQLAGNVAFQYALQGVGLALAVPLTLGTIIIGGALLGRFWLGESVTGRMLLAMVLLLVAIPILSQGAEKEREEVDAGVTELNAAEIDAVPVLMGIGVACLAGFAYAWQGAVLRRMAISQTPHSATLLVLSATGVVALGSLSLLRIGWSGMLATAPADFERMVWAGLFNALGFFLLTKALERITVVHVNAVNASQAAMAALAGVIFFHEQATLWMALGVGLTVAALLLIDRGKKPVNVDEP